MSTVDRRQALAALAGAATLCWLGGHAQASASADRLRPGAQLDLRCPGATSFKLEAAGRTRTFPATDGHTRTRAPWLPTVDTTWLNVVCTPFDTHGPVGRAITVHVLAGVPLFGG